MFNFPKPIIKISIIWQKALESGPLKIDSTLFKVSLLNWSVWVFEEILDYTKLWIVFCVTIDVDLATVFEIPLVSAVDFGIFVVALAKGGSCLRLFAVSIFSPDLLLKTTASCNFENVSPLYSRLVEVENNCLKVVKWQGTAKFLIGLWSQHRLHSQSEHENG